jgi:hypothetical protein
LKGVIHDGKVNHKNKTEGFKNKKKERLENNHFADKQKNLVIEGKELPNKTKSDERIYFILAIKRKKKKFVLK